MIVKQINEQEVKSLLKDCPKQVQDYVKALQNLIEIKDHTNKKALDKIKQLAIPRVRQSLPKQLSNSAYLNARDMEYKDFVKWWDEQKV